MSGPPGFPGIPLPGQPTGVPVGSYPIPVAPVPPGGIPLSSFPQPSSFGFPTPMRPMLIPGAGLIPPVMPVPLPTATVPKSTDVYIGKIANTVEDDTIKAILDVCGKVKSWKRAEDPDTHQPKGFGFCEFEEADGVLRAIRLLNGRKVDGQELQAKASSATEKYVDAYRREKAMRGYEDKEEGEHVETEEQKDRKLLERIGKLLREREEAKHKPKDAAFIQKDHESESNSNKDVESDARDYRRHRRDSPGARSVRTLSRERHDMEALVRDEENAYRKRLHEWESYERKIEKELQRASDIQRELNRERTRLRRMDMEEDSDDEREAWARKPYKNSRRAEARRRRRHEEEVWDEADRMREEKEFELKRQKSEEPENAPEVSEKEEKELEMESKGEEDMEIDAIPEKPPEPRPEEPENGVSEPVPAEVPPELLTGSSIALTLPKKKAPKMASVAPTPLESDALKDVFGEDEEEQPKREIRGLAFSEIDTRPVPDPQETVKSLIDALPKTKEEVYNYPIKWEAYESDVAGIKIENWLNKKVSENLGFEETSFIMAQLEQHQPPSELEKDLAEVLDDEQQTEMFIIKLYRTVIYETEKAAQAIESNPKPEPKE